MLRLAGLIAAIALCAGNAWAQDATSNPVMEHYRAYNAALGRGDMAAAETSAAAAVAASEARDGDGGRTPILVMNLAQVRVNSARYAEAMAPARRAVAFAEAGASGLDPVSARLVLGQAELSRGERSAGERLLAQLRDARAAGGRESQLYLAATGLGNWAFSERLYTLSESAWTMAIDLTQQGDPNAVIARANALVGRGAARMAADDMGFVNGSTSTRIRETPEGLAELDYAEAIRILLPVAAQAQNGAALTQAQRMYSMAVAWSTVLKAQLRSLGWEDPAPLRNGGGLMIGLTPGVPMCDLELHAPDAVFPAGAINNYSVGSVVVRVVTDQSGQITERGVVATVGGEMFQNAVERVLPRWRYERRGAEVQACSGASVRFMPYLFYFGDEHD